MQGWAFLLFYARHVLTQKSKKHGGNPGVFKYGSFWKAGGPRAPPSFEKMTVPPVINDR
jgi:hypothetical protein